MTVATDVHTLLDVARIYAEEVSRDIADRQNDPRSMCFWNIHNRIKLTEEVLLFYEGVWGSEKFPDVEDSEEGELVERVVTVTKDLFVDIVSMIEKAAKDTVGIYSKTGIKERILAVQSHLYLRSIIETSRDMGFTEDSSFAEWDDLLVVRNLVAHNNSISDRSKRYDIGDITISMRPGRMMKGPINTFVVLTDRIITLFYRWMNTMKDSSQPVKHPQ